MPTKVCPHCQVEIGEGVAQCPHCQKAIDAEVNPYQSPVEISSAKKMRTWTLIISGVFVAASLLFLLIAPGVSIGLILLAIPTTVRSLLIQRKLIELHGEVSFAVELQTFFASALAVSSIVLSGCVAFVAVCFPTGLVLISRPNGEATAIGLGSAVGLLAAGLVAWLLWWPRKWKK